MKPNIGPASLFAALATATCSHADSNASLKAISAIEWSADMIDNAGQDCLFWSNSTRSVLKISPTLKIRPTPNHALRAGIGFHSSLVKFTDSCIEGQVRGEDTAIVAADVRIFEFIQSLSL